MLQKLLRNRRSPICVDLGTNSVKMLQLQRVTGALGVLASALWRCPASAGQDPAKRRQLIVAAVRDILRKGGFRGRQAVTTLSYHDLNIKNVRLPHMPEHEMIQAVRWEAKERFSFEVNDDRLRYINAGEVRSGNEVQDELIMLAVSQEAMDNHLGLLSEIGLRPQHIEAEPVALFRIQERFLRRRADDEVVSVAVDLGRAGTRVVVARGRRIVFIKNIEIGGRDITEAVAKQLDLSDEEAEELRLRTIPEESGGSPQDEGDDATRHRNLVDWTVHDAIRGVVETLAREISLCLRYCSVTFRGLRPRHVTLTGGGAYDPALVELLTENLTIGCDVGHPLRGIDVSAASFGNSRRRFLAEWALCTGMAIKHLDAGHPARELKDGRHRLSA